MHLIPGFCIRRMCEEDIPSAHQLAIEGELVTSRAPDSPSAVGIRKMDDLDHNFVLVAVPNENPHRVVATAMISSEGTWYRREIVRLNGVVAHPEFRGFHLPTAIMGQLLWHAQHVWEGTSMQWTCEDIPKRQRARAWYRKTLGAENIVGSPGEFIIRFPYDATPWPVAPFYLNHFQSE